MRDEGLGYVVGRPARNSISDVLASRRWRGGTAADMVLAPLLVSNAVRLSLWLAQRSKRLSEWIRNRNAQRPMIAVERVKRGASSNAGETSGSKALETRFAK